MSKWKEQNDGNSFSISLSLLGHLPLARQQKEEGQSYQTTSPIQF